MVSVRFTERSIIMKISEIEVCAVKPVAPPKLDVALPVSERENFLKALNHEKPVSYTHLAPHIYP